MKKKECVATLKLIGLRLALYMEKWEIEAIGWAIKIMEKEKQAQEITVDYPEVIEEHDFYLIETDDTYYVQRKHPENATHRDLSEEEKIICKLAKAVQELIKSKLGGKE